MIRNDRRLFLVLKLIFILPFIKVDVRAASNNCERSCRSHDGVRSFRYPFGFSADCQIRLDCKSSGEVFIGEFPVKSVDSESIRVDIERNCKRPVHRLKQMYGQRYAPTSRNAILLENCSEPFSTCVIPGIQVPAHFDSMNCSSNSNISCYAENKSLAFIDLESVKQKRCDYLLSSISSESLNLEIRVVELGWWLDGNCKQQLCDRNANCTNIEPPNGKQGYRCYCKEGFQGDGYKAGIGCRKASTGCNPSKYLSGECGGRTRVFTLVGGIAAGSSLMISLGLICCFIRRRTKLKARHTTKRRLSEATGNCNIPIYPYKEIEKATNSFSETQRLGTGAFGTVYAAKLYSDEWVAIKRIKYRDSDSIGQVMNEIKLISSVSHPNLVRLLGCSIENGEQILVYEFMPNGTLCQHLQREKHHGLPWLIRLTIATETARAIAYLHSAIEPPIYHRDIKSSNILLDHNFKAKVADFGLSRFGMTEISHISTAPQGTPGYLDPQYHQNFHLSDKSDVYSFGVVLVELITALKVVDFSRPQNEVNLAALATDRIGKGCLDEIVDPFLEPQRDAWTLSSLHKVAELAFRCLAFHRDMRPSMTEVAAELEQVRSSRWASTEEITSTATASPQVSTCSSFSNVAEKPLNVNKTENDERRGKYLVHAHTGDGILNSMDKLKDGSPISVQDSWFSEQSSPSSNSLLSNIAIQ